MDRNVRVVAEADLGEAASTPGLTRRVAAEADDFWFGHVTTEPHTESGWHHHGDTTTIGYVIEGSVVFEFGSDGSRRVEAGPGEFFVVPPGVVHREGNPTDQPGAIVLTRVGEGPPVFNVDGPDPA